MNSSSPPTSLEEWLLSKRLTFAEWPKIQTSSNSSLNLISSESLYIDLTNNAKLDSTIFSDIEIRITELLTNSNLLVKDIYVLPFNQPVQNLIPEICEIHNNTSSNSSDNEFSNNDTDVKSIKGKDRTGKHININGNRRLRYTGHTRGSRYTIDKSLKKAENAIFMGYDFEDLTPMPGQIEPLRILDYVSRLQAYSSTYIKIWKKFFFSKDSITILHDFFWWIWLDRFCPEPETQVKYFARIADCYTSLFQNIHSKFRDSFFANYANCLCQALYLSYWILFPGSRDNFNDAFKDYLSKLIYNCITGVEPSFITCLNSKFSPEDFNERCNNNKTINQKLNDTQTNASIQDNPTESLVMLYNYHFTKFNAKGISPLITTQKTVHMSEYRIQKHNINRLEISSCCEVAPLYTKISKFCKFKEKESSMKVKCKYQHNEQSYKSY